jgi:type I restriction enzyme S subunit
MTMNPDWLLKHFEQISEALDAVPRLRRFILNLAVRGKLVEQNPEDEPASELLKRIEQEKVRSNNAAGIRKTKPLQPTIGDDVPFSLPKTWLWARLGEVFDYDAGTKTEPKQLPKNAWLLELEDIEKDSGKIIQRFRVDERSPKSTKSGFHPGDVLYGKLRPYLNKAVVADSPGFSTTEIVALRCYGESAPRYTCLAMRRPDFVDYVTRLGQGTKMPRLRTEDALSGLFPLPPLAEQHRIVAKVDELMALADELEAAQAKRERRRDRLVAATLHGLGRDVSLKRPLGLLSVDSKRPQSSSENGGFGETALPSFFLNHLPHLTTRPEHIQQLRQTILNLAVRGKLVPQDPTDEPASKLLARIRDRRTLETGKEKKTQMPQPLPLNPLNAPFILPAGWAWARFPDLGIFGRGKSKHRPRNDPFLFEGGTHLFVQTGDVARSKGVIGTFTDKYNDAGLAQSAKWPKGTLCITIAANIADSGILSFDACFPDSVVGFIPAEVFPNARYFEYFIRTAKAELLEYAPATAQKNINISILNEVLIPLPPLVEQHRIVGKVDKLMALCDELEARLTTTATNRRQLLKATLSEAIAS